MSLLEHKKIIGIWEYACASESFRPQFQSQSNHQQAVWPWLFHLNSPCVCYLKRKGRDDTHCLIGEDYRWRKRKLRHRDILYWSRTIQILVSETKFKLVHGNLLPQVTWKSKFGHSSTPSLKLYHRVFISQLDPHSALVSFFWAPDVFFLMARGRLQREESCTYIS